jgi:hypothetical protein
MPKKQLLLRASKDGVSVSEVIREARHRRGGNQAMPDGVRLKLELLGERRFAKGVVPLHYGTVA